MLYYRDLKVGTLDLGECDRIQMEALLEGRAVTLSRLFTNEEQFQDARRRARAIHKKALEHYEERGIETLFLANGLATWRPTGLVGVTPSAPILLRPAILNPRGATQEDFNLVLTGEMEVSSTLLHRLETDFKCVPDQSKLELDGVIDTFWELEEAARWLKSEASAIPGFDISPRFILGTFSYMKLPMVRDLADAYELILSHDLISAMAGDDEARQDLREGYAQVAVSLGDPDHTPPADEFLILDADASQNYAINAVLRGQDLIIRGPPGTGKSQTIANLIATLVARGQRVLFVAEKRAAIDAVVKRLTQVGLAEIIFDIHGGVAGRRQLAQSLARSLEVAGTIPTSDRAPEFRLLESRRDDLNAGADAFRRPRSPWGVSVFEAQVGIIGTPDVARTELRLSGEVLERLDSEAFQGVSENLHAFASLGGLSLATSSSPWAGATVTSADEARDVFEAVRRLRQHTLPAVSRGAHSAAAETRVRLPAFLGQWESIIDLWGEVATTLQVFLPEVYKQPLEELCVALEPANGGVLARARAAITSSRYRKARKTLRNLVIRTGGRRVDLYARSRAALEQSRYWTEFAQDGSDPCAPVDLSILAESYAQLSRELGHLDRYFPPGWLIGLTEEELIKTCDRLLADQASLTKLPELHRLEQALRTGGLEEALVELKSRQLSPDLCRAYLRYGWLQSILERVRIEDPLIGAFDGSYQTQKVETFRSLDKAHIESAAERVGRLWAERVVRARESFADQDTQIKRQAGLKRKLKPFRQLFAETKDLLLELKPCWVMSPLVVSQVLPPERLFDVVIFDEASQIRPADAVPAVARGQRLALAGDERQLPPTNFFLTAVPEEEEEEQEAAPTLAATEGFESILESLGMLLPLRMLTWHYRSQDERLIAFSNAYFYDRSLTTFPGIGRSEPLSHLLAPFSPGRIGQEESVSDEVLEVTKLIIEHAETRPDETLGVIAMGIKHANRIEEHLREALRERPDLDEFFSESHEERFFVKNLERVQGDERDAIILSIGYGKTPEGRMLYRFGPINTEGGERRLNVAVTRARKRVAVVSSFGSAEMDPERLRAEGAKLLRAYLQYAESAATNLGDRVLEKPPLNPFEIDVRDSLTRANIPLVPQLGVSGYWIDFAAKHPTKPGRFVLAIECDGASYHSSSTARDRDRLRQEQLGRQGWRFHRIWSADWFNNKDQAVARVIDAYRKAVEEVDGEEKSRAFESPAGDADPTKTFRENRTWLFGQDRDSQGAQEGVKTTSARGAPRPPIPRGYPIEQYTHEDLVALARWIESDTLLRTQEELIEEMMRELGFHRKGSRIVERLTHVVAAARRYGKELSV